MRKIILLLIFQASIQAMMAQDCDIVTEVHNDYLNDAKILALREIWFDTTSSYTDSIELPPRLTNKYLGDLSVIYSMDSDVTDAIFNEYNIHALPNMPYREINLIADTNYNWVQNFLVDSVISGNTQFDSLMTRYDFKLQSYYNLSDGVSIQITTPRYLNLKPLVDLLEQIRGLDEAHATESWAVEVTNIHYSSSNDTTYIRFSMGWGDCVSGCMYRKYWNFSVYDCDPVYLGISGDIFTSLTKKVENNYTIYPNPVRDILTIEKWDKIEKIDIYNLQGKLIIGYDKIFNQLDMSGLATGQYILHIQDKNNDRAMMKIIKQ